VKHYESVEVLPNFTISSPLAQMKSSPIEKS